MNGVQSAKLQSAKLRLATGQFPTISLKWPIKVLAGEFTLYTWPIEFMKNWNNGRPFQISYFALWVHSDK